MIATTILLACSYLIGVTNASCAAARDIWLSAGGSALLAPNVSTCCTTTVGRIYCNAQNEITRMYSLKFKLSIDRSVTVPWVETYWE
jgi:hypothetical protein